MVEKHGIHNMTVLYPIVCYNEVCYKGLHCLCFFICDFITVLQLICPFLVKVFFYCYSIIIISILDSFVNFSSNQVQNIATLG